MTPTHRTYKVTSSQHGGRFELTVHTSSLMTAARVHAALTSRVATVVSDVTTSAPASHVRSLLQHVRTVSEQLVRSLVDTERAELIRGVLEIYQQARMLTAHMIFRLEQK